MDEKKLAALYLELKTMGANISIPQEDFIIKMKSRPDYVAKVGKVAKSGSIDFDTYITPISANPFDLMREAVSEKPVAEKEVSPVDYYNQAKPQPHAELVDGEPQNVLGLLSPDKKKLPKQVLQEKVVPNAYEQQMTDVRENLTDAPISEIERSIENKRPEFNETDPIQVGMQQREKRAKEVQSLLPTAKQETTLGFKVNPVDLATKIDPNKVTDIGVTALKYAQEKELPNEIRDAIIGGDDRAVSDYLLLHDDNYRLNYADKQDIAQAESAFKRPVTPQDRMALWQGRTATYAKQDQEKYGEEADWLSPYVMLQKGDNTKLSEKLERIKPLFKNQDGSLYYDEELAKKDVIKESAKLGSFAKPEEKLMAYYQILANRQKTLENLMNQKYSNYAGRSQFELQNPGVSDKPTSGFESALSDLQYGQLMGGALSYIGADFLSRPEAKEWYKNANQLNAIAKYIKKGGAQKDETWGDTFKGVAQDLMAAERYAKGLNVDVISTARQDIGNIQRGVMSQLGIAPTPEEAERLKVQANKGEGLFSADTYIGFAYQQAAIGTQLFLARGMTPTSQVPKLLTPLTNVSKGSTLGKALFSNSLSSKVANKVYSGLIGALGTGIEYQMVGSLSGEEKGSSIRDEMTFGSGVVGSAGKSAAKPFTNWLGKVAGNRIGNAAKRVIQGGASEIAEETPQTIYQAWEQKGGWEGVKEGVEEIIGKDDESTWRRVNKTLGFFVSMGLGGYLDGGTSEELYQVMETMIPDVEAASGEKVDKDLLKDILDGMQEGVKDKPVGINVTDNVANFQINGKEFNYTPENGAVSDTEATSEEIEIANKYGKEIIESHEETAIPQPQEVPAQEIVQETPEIAEQETPIIESAEAIQETPEVEVAEIEQPPQKTAEELDVRRGEIESRLPQIEAELEALRSKPILESTEEDADMEDFLLAEQADLQNEFEDIAETRKTVRTAKETETEQEAQRVEALMQKTQRVADIKGEIAQIEEASKSLPIRDRLSAKANIEALNAEKGALSMEIEALQPKKETPTIQENRIVETPIAETPIIAETPQLETPKPESKGAVLPTPITAEMPISEMEKSVADMRSQRNNLLKTKNRTKEQENSIKQLNIAIGKGKQLLDKAAIEKRKAVIKAKKEGSKGEISPTPIEKPIAEQEVVNPQAGIKISKEKGKTWIESFGAAWKDAKEGGDGNKMESIYNAVKVALNGIAQSENTVKEFEALKSEIESHAKELREAKKQESKPQEKETPVAPAAPKEEKPQPEKGESKRKPKTEPPKPPATQKEPTTIKPVNSGSELAEMLGNTEQAIETGKVWDRVAKMWAKKTGKTIEDWWDRIESIQVGGEGQKGSVKFENGKFIVFLASDRDVSTPVHELAHIFQTDLSESEKKSVVDWYNKGNKTNHKVTDWGFAENETSRNISEYFAEGFVEWLKEGGKTTDKAMQSVFDKFAKWLKEVVISSIFDAKVELNEDMRAIYEQIFTEKEKRQVKIDRRGAKKGAMIRVVPRDLIDKSATNPLQVVWNYFAEGGRINREDAIKRLKSRHKGKEIPSDIMIAIAPFIKKEGQKRGDIVHNLYEIVSQDNPLLGLTDQDFDSAMDEVLDSLGGNFRGDMIVALQGFKNKEEEYVPTEDEIMEMENREAIDAAMYELEEENPINPKVYDYLNSSDKFDYEFLSNEIKSATDKNGNVDWKLVESGLQFIVDNLDKKITPELKSLINDYNESRQEKPSEGVSNVPEQIGAETAADKAYRAKREAEFAEKIGKLRQNLKTAKDEAAKKYATLTKNEIGFEKEGKNVQLELVSEAEKEMSDIERIMIPYKSAIADIEREIKRLQDAMDKVIDAEIKAKNEKGLFDSEAAVGIEEKEEPPIISEKVEVDSKKQPVGKVEKLEDYGEKIGGAKKDLVKDLDKITVDALESKPLGKVFPQPDYQKLVANGIITQEGAIFLKFAYDNIPTKPRKSYYVASWVKTVQGAIGLFKQVIESEGTKNTEFTKRIIETRGGLSETLKRDYEMFSAIMKGLGFPAKDVKLGNYRIKKFEERQKWNKETGRLEDISTKNVYSIVNNSSIIKDFDSMEAAIEGLGRILNASTEETKGTKFDLYQDRKTKDYFIGKKGAINVVRIVEGFKTLSEAKVFLKEKQEEVQKIWDGMKENPNERRAVNSQRVGVDWRKGKNITSEEFGETFGFRGVEFGNWVNNSERQNSVNEAYDALMDLASVLNVSPKALSLNGELGFAFGARGSGRASAHYEAEKVVINLTKTKGAGSLAHEWWHAIDNYFSRKRGKKDEFITNSPIQRMNRDGSMDKSVRKEMLDAFKAVRGAIEKSNLRSRSEVLDKAKSTPYWSTIIEMSARSFENYIIEKLGNTNQRNDYLANFKEVSEWINDSGANIDALKNYPYPLANESAAINESFAQFFDTIQEDKETNTLYQTDPYHKSLEDWVISEVTADELAQDPKEARDFVFEYIEPYVGKDVANEIIDRAFNRILYPITDAEKKLSEHADKIEAKAEAVRAVEMESLPQEQIDELREVAKKEGETITDSTTQEERIEIRNRLIDDFVGKGMTQQAAEQLVGQYIRERSFGSKFREKYAPQMSKELRDAVMDKTYLYGVVSNASAIQKAQALVNDWYERAIEQAANEWSDKADPKNEDFVADTYEKLMDVINNELFGSKVTTDYYVKVAAALYATKLADTLVGNLKGNAKTRVIDKLVTLVEQLAELGTVFGRTINMFGVMTNVKGGVLQAIFNKEMSAVIANMSKTQKTAKDAIESVINGVSDMVEGLKSGSDKGLLQDLADAMQNNPAIDRLLEKIVQNATNEQDIIDILDKIDGLEADKTALEKEIKDKKILEEKIKEKNKEIATLKRKLADKPVKTPTKKAEAQKAAVKTKYESLIDDVVSFGKNLFQNKLYQAIEGFESTLLDTYKEEVINKVNDVMKNITDYVYLGNKNASPTKLYEMIQDAARKEFAQKYLEKADIQPEIPINTNPNLTKTEEARNEAARKKNAEKAAQKQLHTDILDAIKNDKFKASIEQYIQENREKDIRNQMRKRVVGIVNNTEITEKDKKVELRKALAQMVAEAATSTNEAAKGIKDFMRTYFDVGGKDVSEFEQEFDRLWEAQVKRKQQELIKKRLQTSDEKEQKLTDKAVAELLENLEKDKEFGHKFMEDLAKNVRITQGNWEAETAKRFREHYHIPLLTQANQKKIADMIKYVDSLPNDSDAKQGAMDVIMTEYLNIVGIENIDRWVSLIDVMFHVNNLLNIGTQWQNIKDSLYQVLHDLALPVANFMGEVVTAMRDRKPFGQALSIAQRSNLINAKTVWKTLFSQSTYRLIYNQFSVKEARAIGEYSSFMDYFAKNFAELPRKLKGFQFKSALDFIQYGIPAGLMTLYDGVPLSTITNALLGGFDMALGNTLQMGRMANILSRKGIASQEAIDLADISKAGSRRMEYNGKMQTIDEILTDERGKGYFAKQEQIVDMWNKAIAEGKTEAEAHEVIKEAVRNGDIQSEYKREWRRKMQLFADYVEQEHAAWIIADTYRKNATYKNDPTGVLGWIYNGVNTALVRNLRQSEIEAREAYKKDKTFTNLRKQKWAQLLKIGAERILGTAYFRTKINIFNKQKLNSFFGSLITAIKNYVPYMDTEAAMKLAINKKGELKPNSLWYVDDLVNKGFLSEAKKKVQTDIDNIAGTATANKEKVTKREDTQIEKIDNQIADKEKTLSEKIESIDKFSTQKQDAIDRKIDKRQDIVAAFSEKIQAIQDLFSNKEQKILDDTQAAIEKLESKIVQIEINAVDKISAKNAKIESKINQYVHKRERIYLQTLLIDKRIESETSDFESAILQLKEQEKAISKGLNKEDKQKLADFVDKKQQQIADLHGKRLAELNKQKGIKVAQMQEAITLFEFQLENYKNIYESSIDYIERDVQRAVEAAEIAIQKATSNLDEKIAENNEKKEEAAQKAKEIFSKRIASLDFELNVAINVEKERYDRQKAYLQRVFDTDKAKLEAEKKLIADRAKAERANIDDLAKTKSTPLSQDITKIDKRIASHNESYRIGVADETARRFRIAGVNALIGTSAFLFLKAILAGDADDEDEPFIDVVGDITPAEGGTKTQNQNQKEANSKKKIIIRAFGQQMSFNFASFTMIQDLLAWGEVFDYLREKKKGIVSDKSIGDVVLRPILTSYQQALAFRDAETLNFMDKFTEPSERAVRIAANLSPIKVPAQAKQIISDFYYGGQQYAYPENEAYFQQYLRMIGAHPELISTEQNRYAKQYSVIDGQPLYRYAGDNTNEVNRLLSTGIWGKETATSFNEFTVKPDRFNVLYKEMEFKKWLYDRGLTDAINITNPKDVVPKVADNILLGLDPLPQDEFQENIVKPTAMQASDKLREMYKSGDYNGKSKDDIIEKVKANTMGEEVAKEYLESDRSNEAAFNIGLKYIVKDIWEGTQKEVLGAYLETKPRYKLPTEKTQAYKDRLELK